ncbi:MAG: hypothetical protein Ct9H300mP1_15710 [Planctomycetaceae bacterium]|nr:MAG: hypothetical protein Ct9H300mP1_15710 [Planctomycetaceae bacterium]
MLTDADLKYLQDAEHFGGFVLGDRALPLLAEALRDDDRNPGGLLLGVVRRPLFDDKSGEIHHYPFATFRSWTEDTTAGEPTGRDEFVETLLAYRREFDKTPSVTWKVMQMQPSLGSARRPVGRQSQAAAGRRPGRWRPGRAGHQVPLPDHRHP